MLNFLSKINSYWTTFETLAEIERRQRTTTHLCMGIDNDDDDVQKANFDIFSYGQYFMFLPVLYYLVSLTRFQAMSDREFKYLI